MPGGNTRVVRTFLRTGNRMSIRSCCLASAVLATALLLSACSGGSPEGVVKSFYKALDNGEVRQARSHLSKRVVEMLGENKLDMALGNAAQQLAGCGGIGRLDVALEGKGEVRKGSASVTFKGDCPAKKEAVSLMKEDGKWKISAGK